MDLIYDSHLRSGLNLRPKKCSNHRKDIQGMEHLKDINCLSNAALTVNGLKSVVMFS